MISTLYLDLATETGWCRCMGSPKNFMSGVWYLGEKKPMVERFLNLSDMLIDPKYNTFRRIVTEKCFSRGKNDAPVLYGLHAILKLYCHRHGIELIEIEPSKLKKWLTGKGNAPKQLMLETLYSKYRIVKHNHNEGDAIALMLYDHNHNRGVDRPEKEMQCIN